MYRITFQSRLDAAQFAYELTYHRMQYSYDGTVFTIPKENYCSVELERIMQDKKIIHVA